MTRIKAQLVLFTDRNQKNGGLSEYFGSICYPREHVLCFFLRNVALFYHTQ